MLDSIIVTSLREAKHRPYQQGHPQDVWISLSDPEDEATIKKLNKRFVVAGVKHFYQFFRDWSDEDQEPYIQQRIENEGPQESHLNNLISFLERFVHSDSHHNLGINCYAGISRSTALCIIAWVMQGKPVQEALEATVLVRPIAWPNLRMLRLASARLGKNIMNPVLDWKTQKASEGIILL